jgi:hypothetical protein
MAMRLCHEQAARIALLREIILPCRSQKRDVSSASICTAFDHFYLGAQFETNLAASDDMKLSTKCPTTVLPISLLISGCRHKRPQEVFGMFRIEKVNLSMYFDFRVLPHIILSFLLVSIVFFAQ